MQLQTQLPTAIPVELSEEFLKRVPYLSEGLGKVSVMPGGQKIEFEMMTGFEGQHEVVAARLSELAEKLCINYRPGSTRCVAKRSKLPSEYRVDPHPELEARGDILRYGRGRYGLGPRMVRLIDFFEIRAKEMAQAFEAGAHTFPSLIGADVLDTCRYLKNFPASLNLVSHLREDHAVLQEFAQSVKWNGDQMEYNRDGASGVECLLSPSVCFHWYRWLRGTKLEKPVAVTALGKCFRYESSNLTGLERLWDFAMREIILVGPSDYVLTNRDRLVQMCALYLDELGLAYEISTATDPFFVDSYAVQAAYQQGFELKFELLTPLPYSGKKLAVGSINYHQDFFGRSFGIESEGAPAHTGCLGFGYERLALAFLAQHGLDESSWPSVVRDWMRG